MKTKIPRCPRCRGFLFYPFLVNRTDGYYRDKLKCFSCSRTFVLSPVESNNGYRKYRLTQYPMRNEYIDTVFIEIPKEKT